MPRTSFHRLLLLVTIAGLLAGCAGRATPATPTAPTAAPTGVPAPTSTPAPTGAPTALPAEPVQPIRGRPTGTDGYSWWNDAVFYEIFVRSFADSGRDGVGDFNGIIEKLDYLNDGDPATTTDLGVTGLWLMPIHPSPSYHGYDVTDYYAVNPQYGTLQDFRRLLEEAHRRGIRVLIDLVINHSSRQHDWFQQSRSPDSPYRDWYRWLPADPGRAGWRASSNGAYYGYFDAGMPDLNYENPAVSAKMLDVVRFWLQDVGVDGFRVDGARYLIEEGDSLADSAATHAWYKDFHQFYKSLNPDALVVGEAWTDTTAAAKYVNGQEFDLVFDFDLARGFVKGVQLRQTADMRAALAINEKAFPPGQFAAFLTNHDQDRVASQLGGSVPRAKLAATLLLTAPGVPFIYYGEEIGMTGAKPDPLIRAPMQWNADEDAGFTTSSPWQPANADFPQINVAAQSDDPDSLLAAYRALIRARADHAALRVGATYRIKTGSPNVYAVLRASKNETILIVVNLSKKPLENVTLSLETGPLTGGQTYPLAPILASAAFAPITANGQGGFTDYLPLPVLPPESAFVLQLAAGG